MLSCSACNAMIPDDAAFCPECGAPQASAEPERLTQLETIGAMGTIGPNDTRFTPGDGEGGLLEPGSVFAERYEVEALIGRGGMGAVYRASDQVTGKPRALKLIAPHLMGSESAVQRLIEEGTTAQDIRHDNVVSVYDVGRADGQIYVSMEMVEGVSLREWIKRQPNHDSVPMRVASRIIVELLEGLKAAHAKGVIHRDLKPENIILTAEPNDREAPLKILDFGIARKIGTESFSSTARALGTIEYMAPEQKTNPERAGPPADLYSVSKIFYELLVTILPSDHWQPPSGGRTDVPGGIDELIRRGLSTQPNLRPQSAADYIAMLKTAVNTGHLPQMPQPPSPEPTPYTPPSPTPSSGIPGWLLGVGGAVVGCIVLVSVIAMAMSGGGGTKYDDGGGGGGDVVTNTLSMSDLSGVWMDGVGVYDAQVYNNGNFSAEGVLQNGAYVTISGRIPSNGSAGSYTMSFPNGARRSGSIAWDGYCHLNASLQSPGAGFPPRQVYHIDHPPSSNTCPPHLQ
ncbi:MAG: serine/threonine protein kinase [Hyphomonadaceae bacterium]|nr:serine/threonine protein kinase [Hyphomonadaceae bacterium]